MTELNGDSFVWSIQLSDSTIDREIHFFRDSLYVLAYSFYGQKHAQLGYWNVDQDLLYTSLHMNDVIKEFSPRVDSWDGHVLKLSYDSIDYEATKMGLGNPKTLNLLMGSWFAPADSIPSSPREFDETGEFLINPIFTFTKDSFEIRTDGYYRKGPFHIVNERTNYVVLEVSHPYWMNDILILDSMGSDGLKVRILGNMYEQKTYKLERVTQQL